MNKDYYHTKESVEEYINLAKDVSGINLIKKLQPFLSNGSEVLEIGSGPGTDWKILSEYYNVTGSDISREFLVHLKKNNPSGRFFELDAVTLNTKEKFDCIYSNKVLHHLKDKELTESINNQYEILNPGGIICHSFWRGEGTEVFKGMFVNYYTVESLRKIFESKFDIFLLEEYKEFEDRDSILLIGGKNQRL